ncbi:aldo/keto reductase [Ottowia sp.]|uniref:aldo/keto reductase n=1 Tax=Ottowia sp. TaxID=1898956 RepID=UPI0025DA89ED|nr:aldo/keto reductase [Ottowia sp.]
MSRPRPAERPNPLDGGSSPGRLSPLLNAGAVNVRHACLGLNGITASRIGFGCMGLSGTYGPVERAQATAALHAALDAGIDFFDTADVYGGGENERLVGEALRPHRQRVVLATKGAPPVMPRVAPQMTGPRSIWCAPVKPACSAWRGNHRPVLPAPR